MAKFIKEVTREEIDLEALEKAVYKLRNEPHPLHTYECPVCHYLTKTSLKKFALRLVMSKGTWDELKRRVMSGTWCEIPPQPLHGEIFGCPVDINDGLGFGDVLFTVDLKV